MKGVTGNDLTVDHLKFIGLLGVRSKSCSKSPAMAAQDTAAGYPSAAPAPAAASDAPAAPVKELTKEELAKMSKDERKAYHAARMQAAKASAPAAKPKAMTKEQRRAIQEAQRKAIADKKDKENEGEELLKELVLQGLSEEQAREVMAAMKEEGAIVDQDDDAADDEEAEDLLGSVRRWMGEHVDAKVDDELLRDFNMSVRFQGHVDTTPPDHVGCILQVLAGDACAASDLKAPKIQPNVVCKKATPMMKRWAFIIDKLYGKIDDVLTGTDAVVHGVQEGVLRGCGDAPEAGRDCAVVGVLMALREASENIADDDLLTGCRRLEPRSKVMEKFIEFLEEACEEESDEDDED